MSFLIGTFTLFQFTLWKEIIFFKLCENKKLSNTFKNMQTAKWWEKTIKGNSFG